jgi:hypothetical protein
MTKENGAFASDGKVLRSDEFELFQPYFVFKRLHDIVMNFPGEVKEGREVFIDLLKGMLQIDPKKDFRLRWHEVTRSSDWIFDNIITSHVG